MILILSFLSLILLRILTISCDTDQYDSACRALSYAQVVLSNAANKFPSHLFSKEIESTANARRPAFVHLAKELAVLSTNLPAGIWLRGE